MRILAAGLVIGLMLATVPAFAGTEATYKLQRGDTVRLRIMGIADLSIDTMIDVDGMIMIPYAGPIDAENKTIVELREIVALQLNGRTYRYFGRDGGEALLTIGRDDIQLSVAEYRPITVYGAVLNPGDIPYRAGMTVRAALARAGSIQPLAGNANANISLRAAQVEGDVRALMAQRDHEVAVIWRLREEAEQLGNGSKDQVALPKAVHDRWGGQQIALLDQQMEASRTQVERLNRAIDTVHSRIGILDEREKAESKVLEEDNDEMERVDALFKKGIVSNQRISDVRKSQLLSATRVLQTQDAQSQTQMDKMALELQLDQRVSDRMIAIQQQIDQSDLNVTVFNNRIEAAQKELALLGVSVADTTQSLVMRIHRTTGSETVEIVASMDDTLLPGDVLEVSLEGGPAIQ
jgi:polysaccharide export outer membrane protein